MPRYLVTVFCERCSKNHPAGIELDWPGTISPSKTVAEVFADVELPESIAEMARNYFTCPRTGGMFKQTDNNKLFLLKIK